MASAGVAASLQTFVLRVSIHCHGCKKKVRKVLKGLEGVQEVKVDAQQHKVTVTGTVDAETLVRRLHRSGKQALPWQHAPPAEPAKKHDAKAAPAVEAAAPQGGDGAKDGAAAEKKPEEAVKAAPADSSEKQQAQEAAAPEKKPEAEKETESGKKAEAKAKEPGVESKKDGGESEAAEAKAKGAEPTKEAAAKEAGNDEGEAKKTKSKPKDASEASPVAAAVTTDRSLPPAALAAQAPRHAHEAYPYYAPQPVMSYHMAQPRASVSYYAPQPVQSYSMQQQPPQQAAAYPMPPPQQQHQPPPPQEAYPQHHHQQQQMPQWSPSYLYMPYPHASSESSYYNDYYNSPPGTHASPAMPESYRLFDDENPNSCTVM